MFSSIDLDTQKRVNLSLKDATIEEAMKQLLQGQEGIGYEIKDKKIVIKRLTVKQAGNTVKVKGNVVDAFGEPVVGATVKRSEPLTVLSPMWMAIFHWRQQLTTNWKYLIWVTRLWR